MTEMTNTTSPLEGPAILAIGLLGAGAAIGTRVLLGNADHREACGRIMRDLGVPEACRVAASIVLSAAAKAVSGRGGAVDLRA